MNGDLIIEADMFDHKYKKILSIEFFGTYGSKFLISTESGQLALIDIFTCKTV